jgi:hypothetical protein
MVMGIGITTAKSDMDKEKIKTSNDGMGRSDRGGRGGMRGGHGPGGGGSRSKAVDEPFEVWIKSTLAVQK